MKDLKEELILFCSENKINATRMLKTSKYKYLYDFILENTPDIIKDDKYPLKMKIFWILNEIKEFPKCENPECNNLLYYTEYSILNGCRKTCSPTCARKAALINTIKTCTERYGTTNGGGIPSSLEKIKLTSLKRFGTTNVFASEYGKNKIKNTCLEKYGCEHYSSTSDFLEKVKTANRNKYGVDFPLQSKEIIDKIRMTCYNKYGVDWTSKDPRIARSYHTKYIFNNINFDSIPEIAFYIWLRDNQYENFEYKPNTSFKYIFNNKIHYYMPDFRVNDKFYEIKGDHFFKNGKMICPFKYKNLTDEEKAEIDKQYEAKYQCMISNNIVILKSAEYNIYIKYVKNKYGPAYLNQFKRKTNELFRY